MTLPGAISLIGLGVIGAAAAWSDWRFRRLPNAFCLIAAMLGLLQLMLVSGAYEALSALIHSALALSIGAGLYTCGGIGGGDIKFYSAVACWFPLRHAGHLLGAVSIAGFVLAAIWLLIGRAGRNTDGEQHGADLSMVPFGVAIATGSIIASLAFVS